MINKILSKLKFLNNLKIKLNQIRYKKIFNSISQKKILVIGETIIDRYVFSEVVGKSGKEPMLVLNEKFKSDYVGGAASIVKQIVSYNKNLHFLTCLGEKKNILKQSQTIYQVQKFNIFLKKHPQQF